MCFVGTFLFLFCCSMTACKACELRRCRLGMCELEVCKEQLRAAGIHFHFASIFFS